MTGLSGTEREKSLLTRIFSPPGGTLMCWYAMDSPAWGTRKRRRLYCFCRPIRLIYNSFCTWEGRWPSREEGFVNLPSARALRWGVDLLSGRSFSQPLYREKGITMKQLLAVLVAA